MSRGNLRKAPPGSPSAKEDIQAAAAEAVAAAQTGPAKKAAAVKEASKAGKVLPNPLVLTPQEADICLAGLNALNKGGGVDIQGAAVIVQLFAKLHPAVQAWKANLEKKATEE